jgi:hypothetical protein
MNTSSLRIQPIAFALLLTALLASGARPAQAQVADDAGVRAWLDMTFYSGHDTTALAPVLQADLKFLGVLRLGLDLPFAYASTTLSSSVLNDSPSASQFTLATPALHGAIEIEAGPLFLRAGLGFAVSMRDTDITSNDDLAGFTAMTTGMATRGAWNPWWYTDAHAVFAPGELSYRGDDYALGVEGALMALFPRDDQFDTQTGVQIGAYLAAITDKTSAIGLRWRNVIAFHQGPMLIGQHAQSSVEVYAETRVMKLLLLGGGFLLNLDEPFGVFGDGADIWAVRLKAGLAL